jgi:hypothetical protein
MSGHRRALRSPLRLSIGKSARLLNMVAEPYHREFLTAAAQLCIICIARYQLTTVSCDCHVRVSPYRTICRFFAARPPSGTGSELPPLASGRCVVWDSHRGLAAVLLEGSLHQYQVARSVGGIPRCRTLGRPRTSHRRRRSGHTVSGMTNAAPPTPTDLPAALLLPTAHVARLAGTGTSPCGLPRTRKPTRKPTPGMAAMAHRAHRQAGTAHRAHRQAGTAHRAHRQAGTALWVHR